MTSVCDCDCDCDCGCGCDCVQGKPIQTNTVVSHILDALLHARSVDLHRLVKAAGVSLPTEREWNSIEVFGVCVCLCVRACARARVCPCVCTCVSVKYACRTA